MKAGTFDVKLLRSVSIMMKSGRSLNLKQRKGID
jgi:hypothetical protein